MKRNSLKGLIAIERIAIIGMGISGTATLTAYWKLQQAGQLPDVSIDYYDSLENMGCGPSFNQDSEHALLNTRTNEIGFDYENQEDFQRWVEENYHSQAAYVPRQWFGEYLQERLKSMTEQLKAKSIADHVESLCYLPERKQWRVQVTSAEPVYYDRVHLCTGDLPKMDFYELKDTPGYVHDPYPLRELPQEITSQTSVVIIGTSLSALDVLKYLQEVRELSLIHIFSRRNQFPIINPTPQAITFKYLTEANFQSYLTEHHGHLSYEQLLAWIRQECQRFAIDFDETIQDVLESGTGPLRASLQQRDFYGYLEAIAMELTRILNHHWHTLSIQDQNRFLDTYDQALSLIKAGIPDSSAQAIIQGEDDGQLLILPDVTDLRYDETSEIYQIIQDGGKVLAEVEWVINATGLDLHMRDLDAKDLLAQALNQAYIERHHAGGLTMHVPNKHIISPRFGDLENLHPHGMLTHGALYHINSVYSIQRYAHELVQALYVNA